ncbi:MAG: D-alanyl-D-alanine carboxypeptidase [Clostridia bacterium]|nr:D-alanyl-D-alanine carboxypeptidase [Clostridia bacterium]
MKATIRAVALLQTILTVVMSFLLLGLPAAAAEPPAVEHAKGVYLYNLENEELLLACNENEPVYPASTVKIMTGLVAIEALSARLDERVTITADMLKGVTGNNIALKAGETVTVRDMLYAALCGGYNDACAVLAHLVGGNTPGFVKLMNARAEALGASATYYTNPSGMHHNDMVTTTADTARIALAAAHTPLYMEITSAAKYVMPATNLSGERNIHNRNYLIARNKEIVYYYPAARGLNSGSTNEGGYCLATTAEKNGLTYLCVVMGGEEVEGRITSYTLAKTMLDWAFASYGYVTVLDTDRRVCEVPVTLSEKVDYVTLLPESALTHYLPTDLDLEAELTYAYKVTSASLAAPVEEGQVAGFITVSYGEEELGTVNLITKNAVERSDFLYMLSRIEGFTRSRFFLAAAISAVVLTLIYIIGTAMYRYHRAQHQQHYTRYRKR